MDIWCKYCGSGNVVKMGVRKNKRRLVQRYKCKDCNKIFSLSNSRNKTYSINIVLNSLSYYNLGYTLKESSLLVNKRFKVKTYPQLISSWLKEYKQLCSFSRFRKKNKYKVAEVVFEKLFEHRQPYVFKYHRFKIEHLVNDYFKGLREYIAGVIEYCPDELFVSDNTRISQFRLAKDVKKVRIIKCKTHACKLSALALKAAKSNKERHKIVQDFVLVNDTVTLAVEVPIWLTRREINSDEVRAVLGKVCRDITGHIDLVQNKFGLIYILDYKPEADFEKLDKVVSQLFVYALALSVRTNVWLRNIRCAWFDSDSYFEFNPNLIVIDYLKKKGIKDKNVWKMYWSDYRKHNRAVRKRGMEIGVLVLENTKKSSKISKKISGELENQESDNLDFTSDVVSDSTLSIFLNRFSYDQKGQLNFNANATYGASFLCSPNNTSALGNNEINSSIGTGFIFISSNAINISNSSPDNFDLDNASALCRLISVNNRSGAIKSSLGEKIMCSKLPAIKEDITILASTTNNIYFNSLNFFLYFLYNPSFTFLPNSSASFSESFDLATIDLNNANSVAFSDIALRAISDQFISGKESISCFKSSGIANVSVGILYPPLAVNASNHVYYVEVYKGFGFEAELVDFNEGKKQSTEFLVPLKIEEFCGSKNFVACEARFARYATNFLEPCSLCSRVSKLLSTGFFIKFIYRILDFFDWMFLDKKLFQSFFWIKEVEYGC